MKLRSLLKAGLIAAGILGIAIVGAGAGYWLAQGNDDRGAPVRIIHLDGVIDDPSKVAGKLIDARDDSSVKAVILRIESPGGAVAASQEIFSALRSVSRLKPTIASIGNMGASGGYYSALGARCIMADPGSLTASIGVISEFTNFEGLMNKVGVHTEIVKSGEMKDAGTPYHAMTPRQRACFQGVTDDIYRQFRAEVMRCRKVDSAALDTLADGRVLSGTQALRAHLIDALGTEQDAIVRARKAAGLSQDADVFDDVPHTSSLREWLDPEDEGLSHLLPVGRAPVLFRLP